MRANVLSKNKSKDVKSDLALLTKIYLHYYLKLFYYLSCDVNSIGHFFLLSQFFGLKVSSSCHTFNLVFIVAEKLPFESHYKLNYTNCSCCISISFSFSSLLLLKGFYELINLKMCFLFSSCCFPDTHKNQGTFFFIKHAI